MDFSTFLALLEQKINLDIKESGAAYHAIEDLYHAACIACGDSGITNEHMDAYAAAYCAGVVDSIERHRSVIHYLTRLAGPDFPPE